MGAWTSKRSNQIRPGDGYLGCFRPARNRDCYRENNWASQGVYSNGVVHDDTGRNFQINGRAEQTVGPERRERVSHQTWCDEG